MLLNEILSDTPLVNAKLIVKQLEAVMITEIWGGVSAVAGAAKAGVQQFGQNVANSYRQGETQAQIKKLLNQYATYRQQLINFIQKNPQAFGQPQQQNGQQQDNQYSGQDRRQEPRMGNKPHYSPKYNNASDPNMTRPLPQAWKIRSEGYSPEDVILNELLAGLGNIFGTAKNTFVNKAKQMGTAIGGTYAMGEAKELLKKMVAISKQLQQLGYKISPEQAQDYQQLRQAVGV